MRACIFIFLAACGAPNAGWTSAPPIATPCEAIEIDIDDDGLPLAAYGSTAYPISLVEDGSDLRVFYSAAYDDPFATALIADDLVAERVEVAIVPARVGRVAFARGVLAAPVYVDDRNADVHLAIGRGRRFETL